MVLDKTKNLQKSPLIGIPTWQDTSVEYNGVPLFAINQSYIKALTAEGAIPILIPLNLDEEALRNIFDRLDGLFLSGGTDINPLQYGEELTGHEGQFDSERDEVELKLARWALANNLPVLGICRGMQILNVAAGGTLYHDLATERPDTHKHDYFGKKLERREIRHLISTVPYSYVHQTLGKTIGVNSMHHQAIRRVGFGFTVTAFSDDGLPEAIEATNHPFAIGVQWHPEELSDDQRHAQIFNDFIAESLGVRLQIAI
ncbi:MAG: gamma-glutamyl-gamma-aminobutyrate hydrolase family protein [Chloroflexota bacterium]